MYVCIRICIKYVSMWHMIVACLQLLLPQRSGMRLLCTVGKCKYTCCLFRFCERHTTAKAIATATTATTTAKVATILACQATAGISK